MFTDPAPEFDIDVDVDVETQPDKAMHTHSPPAMKPIRD
jgi:hypothetical protein